MHDRYFDDFQVGQSFATPGATLSESMLLEFAYRYDPQPFHMDAEAAKDTVYGGVIASGWQTILKCIRLFVDGLMRDTAGLASPGLDELRWFKPVRAGEQLAEAA